MGERGENREVDPYNILFLLHTHFPSADPALGWGTFFLDSLNLHLFPFKTPTTFANPRPFIETVWKTELIL